MTQPPNTIDIFTDGACSGNPGPGGWGAVLRWQGHEKEICGGVHDTTNNRMELMAVIAALRSLKRSMVVHVYTDSSYVQKGMTEWLVNWKRRNWKTADNKPVKNSDLWQVLDDLAHQHTVHWHWVKGHAGHPDNERADALARKGISCPADRATD